MAFTKRDLINLAFSEIGMASYVFDLQDDQITDALKRLDSMMATWNGRGIRVGYPLPFAFGDSTPDEATNVPDRALEAIALNLAVRIAPGYGKVVSPDTKASAKSAYNQLINHSAQPVERQIDPYSIPAGAGHKGWRDGDDPFLLRPVDPILTGLDGVLDLE